MVLVSLRIVNEVSTEFVIGRPDKDLEQSGDSHVTMKAQADGRQWKSNHVAGAQKWRPSLNRIHPILPSSITSECFCEPPSALALRSSPYTGKWVWGGNTYVTLQYTVISRSFLQ